MACATIDDVQGQGVTLHMEVTDLEDAKEHLECKAYHDTNPA